MTLSTSGKGSFSDLCEGRTESSPAKSNQLCPGLSKKSGVHRESHCFSGKDGGGPPKVYQSGQVILKDKFLFQCTSDIRTKLQQLQQQDPAVSLDEMVQTATNTFHKRTREGGQVP